MPPPSLITWSEAFEFSCIAFAQKFASRRLKKSCIVDNPAPGPSSFNVHSEGIADDAKNTSQPRDLQLIVLDNKHDVR